MKEQVTEEKLLPDELVEEMRTKHGEIRIVKAKDEKYVVIVKKITRDQYKYFRSMVADAKKKPDAGEWLFRKACVYPDFDAIEAMLADKPALADIFAGDALEMIGGTDELLVKKA